MNGVTCPYCDVPAKFVDSAVVYGGRSYGMIWLCSNHPRCYAYVGVHRGTKKPLGRLANAELRKAKMAAHAAFDRYWKSWDLAKRMGRNEAYRALAEALGISVKQCHIGKFDVDECNRVVEVCNDGLLKGERK